MASCTYIRKGGKMPSEEKVVKNVEFSDNIEKKDKKKKSKKEVEEEDDEQFDKDIVEDDDEDDEDDDDDEDDEDDDEDDDDEDDDNADGLTDLGMYNIMGQFLVDDEGNTAGASLATIAKELGKLNHLLKKYISKS